MKYFIHDSDTGEATEVPRDAMRAILGPGMFQQLIDTGSLSSGTSVYEARSEDHDPMPALTKEPLTVCICAGTAKHLAASIARMQSDGWRESGHRQSDPDGDWHWQHLSKEAP